ncbi:MAG: PEP-CTERM sorting domain-containing protein [Alphaproteobacteria bacterium]|nr:PEP-CTERM sorting domain-containing protein [Alphaproteobacteria bacterium]
MIAGFAAAGVLTLSVPAGAGAIGSSVLEIFDFQLRHAGGGAQLTLAGAGNPGGDITVIQGNSTAGIGVGLNGVNVAAASPAVPSALPPYGAIDLAQQCLGPGCSPFGENMYGSIGQVAPPTSTYVVGDMVMSGSMFDASALGGPAGGSTVRTRADVSIFSGTNDGSSSSSGGADVAARLTANQNMDVEFSFDFAMSLLAFLDTSEPDTSGNTQSATAWSLSIVQLSNPLNRLNYSPSELQQTINLSVDANIPLVDSGSLVSGIFTMLAGQTYQLSVNQQSRANATLFVPEPGMLALFGAGLLLVGFTTTYRRRSS